MPPLYNKQFKWQDDLIHNVGLSFSKKDWVVKEIVYHPLKFAKRRMEDPDDTRPIRIRYFAAFVMKKGKSKEWVKKYKEIYRGFERYKEAVAEYGYDVSTEKNFQYSVASIGTMRMWLIHPIYDKGSVISKKPI
jgi:hypothetical protein